MVRGLWIGGEGVRTVHARVSDAFRRIIGYAEHIAPGNVSHGRASIIGVANDAMKIHAESADPDAEIDRLRAEVVRLTTRHEVDQERVRKAYSTIAHMTDEEDRLEAEVARLRTLARMVCAEAAVPSALEFAHGDVPSVVEQVVKCKRLLAAAEAAIDNSIQVEELNKNWPIGEDTP